MNLDHSPSILPAFAPTPPTLEQRGDLRRRPAGAVIGRQRWNHLLFAHWMVDPSFIQATLPPGLYVDTFAGAAYIGIVPFSMERVRPAWLPPLPWLSWFHELNVRTYVYDEQGQPGVWFYSLDCNQPLAVAIARRFFHLPYQSARMARAAHDGWIQFECQRQVAGAQPSNYAWTPGAEAAPAIPGSLEFFLLERYLLFAADPAGRLYQGRVHHDPYRCYVPRGARWSVEPARLAGFNLVDEPASVLAAWPVDVAIFPLTPLASTAL